MSGAASGSERDQVLDPARCPLCGASNRCAMADPATREAVSARTLDCWCMEARIDRARLAQLPIDLQMRACLCPACAAARRALDPSSS